MLPFNWEKQNRQRAEQILGNSAGGTPNGNVKVYIVDKENKILPDGETGELVIAGLGVGRGYMNLPDKTEAVFIDLNGERAYKTGDLARISPEGEIDFSEE